MSMCVVQYYNNLCRSWNICDYLIMSAMCKWQKFQKAVHGDGVENFFWTCSLWNFSYPCWHRWKIYSVQYIKFALSLQSTTLLIESNDNKWPDMIIEFNIECRPLGVRSCFFFFLFKCSSGCDVRCQVH